MVCRCVWVSGCVHACVPRHKIIPDFTVSIKRTLAKQLQNNYK